MSEEQTKFWKNAAHVLLTALASVLIAMLQSWLASQGHDPLPHADPAVTGTISMFISAFKRTQFI